MLSKKNKYLPVKLTKECDEALNIYCKLVGESKSFVCQKLISIGLPELINNLERRLKKCVEEDE